MKWNDEGLLLATKPYGENSQIVEVFTSRHGRHLGMVKGMSLKKNIAIFQPGTQLNLTWSARLNEHLGIFTLDPIKIRASELIRDKLRLSGFNSMVSLILKTLPERESVNEFYKKTILLLDSNENNQNWVRLYLIWELFLLQELGYGLDLSKCVVTGTQQDLIYVSPKSGRAVSKGAGENWKNKLLRLPTFLNYKESICSDSFGGIVDGFELTGYFLTKLFRNSLDIESLPKARARFFASINN